MTHAVVRTHRFDVQGPQPASRQHQWKGLDGLRGCAVISVVLFHMSVARNGFLGVDVFFVLSGFLISKLLITEFGQHAQLSISRFYLRRALRLYPALLVVTLGCLLAALAVGQRTAPIAHDVLVSITYTSNIFTPTSGLLDHTWTLALEEQFYLVWPVLLLLGLSRGRWGFVPAIVLLAAILAMDLANGETGATHTYVRAMGLPLGCALALMNPAATRIVGRVGWPAIALLAVGILAPLPDWITTGWPVSAGAVLAVPAVAMLTTQPIHVFERKMLGWFGLRSYSLYLWHFPVIVLARHHAPAAIPLWIRITAGLVGSLAAAELSYRYVERPVLRMRDRRLGAARVAQ